eukprot:TRINITY_DN5046_c0_g1_i1.p1 TRINITY_DN5046_c0_g1~~TRINITY_DN5046_c0_g1_i1.p1  ORF type:complete len:247 (+),score=89.61 TRINITY_DN5046_c0_g1_i1:389-1129(+)
MDFDSYLSLLVGDSISSSTALIALVFTIVAIAATLITFKILSRRNRDTLLIAGLSGSGKTTLYYQIRDGKTQETVSSLQENICELSSTNLARKSSNPLPALRIVDWPGHQRMRLLMKEILPRTKAVVFMIDSVDFARSHLLVSEFVYELLVNRDMYDSGTPILIACNKQDISTSQKSTQIQSQLEKQIEQTKNTRKADTTHLEESDEIALGRADFTFKTSPIPLHIVECSLRQGDISQITQFIQQI